MKNSSRFLGLSISIFLFGSTIFAAPPRYQLQVGQELDFSSTEKTTTQGKLSQTGTGNWKVWVIEAPTADSWNIVVSEQDSIYTVNADGTQTLAGTQSSLESATVFSDGRFTVSPNADITFTPALLFPRLPAADETQWQDSDPRLEVTTTYTLQAAQSNATSTVIQSSDMSPISKVTGDTSTTTYTLDLTKGAIPSSVNNAGGNGTEYVVNRSLTGVSKLDATTLSDLATNSSLYFSAIDQYSHLQNVAMNDLSTAAQVLAQAKQVLTDASGKLTDAQFKTPIDTMIEGHDDLANQIIAMLKADATLLGKAAPAWTLKDFSGVQHSLSDYQGQVVVLDFWFASCEWCMLAMPRLVELNNQYAHEAFTTIGMNVDNDIKAAQQVESILNSNYTSMSAQSVYQTYQVQSFPTFMVLDTKGVIQKIFHGYTPTIKEDLESQINPLIP